VLGCGGPNCAWLVGRNTIDAVKVINANIAVKKLIFLFAIVCSPKN
jgi:hypothetical protein